MILKLILGLVVIVVVVEVVGLIVVVVVVGAVVAGPGRGSILGLNSGII